MTESDEDLFRAIDDVLSFVDLVVPSQLTTEQDTIGDVLGCAAVRRLAELLRAESTLAKSDNAATSRVIGRAVIEAWLWAVYLFLDPDSAVDRLVDESEGHHRRLLVGMNRMWELIPSLSSSDLDEPEPVPPASGTANPDVRRLAEATADAMRRHGYNGDRADGKYHNEYRWDSMYDTHPSFDLSGATTIHPNTLAAGYPIRQRSSVVVIEQHCWRGSDHQRNSSSSTRRLLCCRAGPLMPMQRSLLRRPLKQ
ncbi:MAG: hypothetical protein GY925_13860 [Actinomycetia bacterium]|nr:hypothetical protein [Actinomycetes bacterium]